MRKLKNIGIYIHIPFCKRKCRYCDFVSFACKDEMIEKYIHCLLEEIDEKSDELIDIKDDIVVDTIYIGGGTPSIISPIFIEKIINKISADYNVDKNAEVTIEVNPGTIDENKLMSYIKSGINRLSIGLQSANDKLLNMLGRIHTYEEFNEVYDLARKVGFKNINVDLMIGLPKQTLKDVEESLEKIIKKNPKHISVYSLIVEENTKMFDMIEDGTLELPSEDLEREMYWKVKNVLEKNQYKHYEISNFAKNGYESKHNMNCWNQKSYLGFGVAAHSYFDNIRYSNIDNLKQYIQNFENKSTIYNIVFHENQSKEDMMKEYMLLGLRKIDGVIISDFKEKFVDNPLYVFRNELSRLSDEGLIEVFENSIRLTDKGLDLANVVWSEFV